MSTTYDPIFKTVGQALYIVYAMEATDLANKGGTQVAIENLMEQRYGEVKDERERQINMGTMTGMELRGQCAQTRKVVDSVLAGNELYVIWARYGQRKISAWGKVQADRRADGCRGLAESLWPNCQSGSKEAAFALLFGLFASGAGRRRAEYSLRRIERDIGSNKSTLGRDQQLLGAECKSLELRATTRLEEIFIRTGLIQDPSKH